MGELTTRGVFSAVLPIPDRGKIPLLALVAKAAGINADQLVGLEAELHQNTTAGNTLINARERKTQIDRFWVEAAFSFWVIRPGAEVYFSVGELLPKQANYRRNFAG